MNRTLNDQDKAVLEIATKYVRSQLFDRKWPSDVGPVDWRTYHAVTKQALSAYPRRRPKKEKK